MLFSDEDFLQTVGSITENQAEYAILFQLYTVCNNMVFLLELSDLKLVTSNFSIIKDYICEHCHSYELGNFIIDNDVNIKYEKLNDYSEKSVRDDEVFNIAMNISKKNNHVVLVKTSGVFALFNNGKFDLNFKNLFKNRQQINDDYKKRKNINELEFAFESYHLERKHRGCTYIIEQKVSDDVSEQILKTELFHYLDKNTTLHPINEACTSLTNDEESVDIALIDSNGEIAIIEVKYFVMKGFFQNPNKSAYSKSRFKDGYKQLDKYCVHLDDDKNKIHSAYLYMFYAHSDSIKEINDCSKGYYDAYIDNEEKCSNSFKRHYKSTFCDNMVDVK